MRWFMGCGVAICLLLIIISQSIIFPTFFMPFFSWQYNRLDVAETIQVEQVELMRVTGELLDYMRGRRDSLEDIYATVAGVERRFFSDIEIRHMIDVLDLYNIAFLVRTIAFFTLIALVFGMALLKYRVLFVLSHCCRGVLVGFLTLVALLTLIISIDFNHAFNIFHEIFFSNDYWILDPRVDLLINMVPLEFFIHIAIFIALLMLALCAAVITAATLYLRKDAQNMFRV